MSNALAAKAETRRTKPVVKGMLRDMGYILWIAKTLAAEIKVERAQPVRPEMSEFCAVDTAAFAA